jgi:toxin ParE1/3/4
MQRYRVRLMPAAIADIQDLYIYIRDQSSAEVARGYTDRILAFIDGFEAFPECGIQHHEIRPGLRMVGFERRVTVAFVIEGDEVVVLNVLYAGRQFPKTNPP